MVPGMSFSTFASATNPATSISSARFVGSIPARPSRSSASTPKPFRLCRSILRRWPNAACVIVASNLPSQAQRHTARGTSSTDRGCHFRRRREGRSRNVEQNPRRATPIGKHCKATVVGTLARRRNDALRDFLLEHQHETVEDRRPIWRFKPAGQKHRRDIVRQVRANPCRACRADESRDIGLQRIAFDHFEAAGIMCCDLGQGRETARVALDRNDALGALPPEAPV